MLDTPQPVKETTDLNQLIATGAVADRKLSVLVGHNLGNNTLLVRVPLHEFFEISEVANSRNLADREGFDSDDVAQRNLDIKHASKLAIYILKGTINALANRYGRSGHPTPLALENLQHKLGRQPYMALQPITANIRTCGMGGTGLRFEDAGGGLVNVYVSTRDVLWVVDGQHRRVAIQMLFDYLKALVNTKRYPKRPAIYPHNDGGKVPEDEYRIWTEIHEMARSVCTIMVEVHLGLKPDQERQLFHDLNNLTKKIEASLAFQFDQSNHVNMWIKDNLVDTGLIKAKIVERDVVDWHDDQGFLARKDLIGICAILFLNKTNVRGATPQAVQSRSTFAQKFWEAVNSIPLFGTPGAKQKTVAAQSVVIKALAKLAYDFAFGKHSNETHLKTLFLNIPKLPFVHTEPMWRYYQLNEADRKKLKVDGLAGHLPTDSKTIRDIGVYSEKEKIMRFSVRHNDVYPILGDMIRWKLGLPSRHVEKVVAKIQAS